ncbi:MAG: tryptophan--tRNA ligase [Gammaproteobacteria bacterium]|nr:tryptophan--tRNA ligase [Gammaproteobacteria bacterium]
MSKQPRQPSARQTVLTGITTTGIPHLGNYVGAIRPAIAASRAADVDSYYFLADYHALVKNRDPARLRESSLAVAATWLALGLDTDGSVFYRQSDIPEIPELSWIISSLTAKGLMNRAHAYKAAVQENEDSGSKDPDKGITMALFSYPVLMAADILMFSANKVPVGRDQIQHVEMARDIAQRFNHIYGDTFVIPEAVVDDKTAVLTGLDGRKMSKSYDNTIPLFEPAKKLRKLVMKIKTNSLEPGEPKDPDDCTLFDIYKAFATEDETAAYRARLEAGAGWGDAKQELFEYLDAHLEGPREEYSKLLADPGHVESVLQAGAEKARARSQALISKVREAVGIAALS